MKQTAVEWLCEQYHLKQDIEIVKQAKEMEKEQKGYSEEDLNKHVVEFLEWREEYFKMYHGNKNHGLYYARNKYNSLYYNEDRHTALTRKYYNLHELLELFNKFKKK